MKNTISIVAIVVTLISCSPKKVIIISYQTSKVSIDGKADEYGDFHYYSTEANLYYAISNDSSNLYLCLKVSDENIQQQILIAGMNVWLDTVSKTKEQIGLKYPLPAALPARPNFKGNPNEKPDFSILKQNMLLSQKTMELYGFKNTTNGPNSLQTSEGIKLQINWDSSSMIYELAIPIKNWYKPTLVKSDTAKIFTLTISVNALELPSMPPAGFEGLPPGGDMGGTPPGGMGGPGMRPPMDGLTQKKTIKTNFKLHIDVP